ncbi:MAG: DUF4178 domain-containing protein [Verrucomicrobia bacterium]|nr:DUF4178 domain-containing protein [Verrucomicrobiota bacterium]
MPITPPNPTPLTVGSTGQLAGTAYRVVSRVVLGVEEDGVTYSWNEFYLKGGSGEEALLSHELTEWGEQWKLFTELKPTPAWSVAQAQEKRIGDFVELDGKRLKIDYTGQSRVLSIEGEAPEGVEVGDVARYFNARSGRSMVVVSWTGQEIEFFRGMDINRGSLSIAFRWPTPSLSAGEQSSPTLPGSPPLQSWIIGIVTLAAAVAFGIIASGNRRSSWRSAPSAQMRAASAPVLRVGMQGMLEGLTWRIVRRDTVEVATERFARQRNEYRLITSEGRSALLIQAWEFEPSGWAFLEAIRPEPMTTATQAAGWPRRHRVKLDGEEVEIVSLQHRTLDASEGEAEPSWVQGGVHYGLVAKGASHLYLAEWDAAGLQLWRGRLIAAQFTNSWHQQP